MQMSKNVNNDVSMNPPIACGWDGDLKGGGKPESRILAGYYVFNANISFTFQAIGDGDW